MDNEKKILVKKQKIKESSVNKEKNTFCFYEQNKIIILIFIIITAIQFFVIIILLKKNYNKNENKNIIKGRLFLYKEDENNSKETNKNKISIVMTSDDYGLYPTLVSMASALENNNKKENILIYHLLLSHDFNMEYIEYFESLKENYDFRINYYQIPNNIFNNVRKWKKTYTVYFKLLIPLIFPDFERVIYLDSDTLIFKDLSEMFNLPFNNNYILGYPFHTPWMVTINHKHPKIYINAGVLLININKIRRDNKDFELIDFTRKYSKRLFFLEQDGINFVYYKKMGLLPLKYGVYLYGNITNFKKKYLYKLKIKINLNELKKAIDDPSIVHLCCCNPKVWYRKTKHENKFNHICKRYQREFYFYANKTKYYNNIYNEYMN